MATIYQIRCTWAGVTGGGVSTFYTDSTHAAAALTNLTTFWTTLKPFLPTPVSITVPSEGASYDDVSGIVSGGWAIGAGAIILGTGSSSYSAPSGAVVNWLTGTTVGRHRLRGKTFIVPLASTAYDTNGTLSATAVSGLRGAAAALLTGSGDFLFKVWHRPTSGVANDGVSAYIAGSNVPDLAAVLRSRRD